MRTALFKHFQTSWKRAPEVTLLSISIPCGLDPKNSEFKKKIRILFSFLRRFQFALRPSQQVVLSAIDLLHFWKLLIQSLYWFAENWLIHWLKSDFLYCKADFILYPKSDAGAKHLKNIEKKITIINRQDGLVQFQHISQGFNVFLYTGYKHQKRG